MIRRSTLILLSCLSALSVPAIQTKSAASSVLLEVQAAPVSLVAQATVEGTTVPFRGLGIGSRGEPVRQLQRRLRETDYYSGPIDGLYGLETQRAVVALQEAAELNNTGTLNEATWQALEAESQASPDEDFEFARSDDGEQPVAEQATLPTTETVESELPPIDDIAGSLPGEDEAAGGFDPVIALGLGAIGLLVSFGIGFYMANKGKGKSEAEEGWEANGPEAVGIDIDENPVMPSASSVPPLPANPALRTNPGTNPQVMNPQASSHATAHSTNGAAANTQIESPANNQLSSQAYSANYAPQRYGQQMGTTGPLSQVDVIEGLLGELHNPDPAKRRKAIWELGQRGNSIAVQPLVDAMPEADSKEKSLLLAALSEIGIRSLRPMSRAMAIAFQDQNPEVRKNAIRDLSRVYDLVVQISHMLGHATEDEDPEVRQTAAWALEKLNHTRKAQDVDTNMRSFSGGSNATPIDLLSSEASIRRSQEMR